MIFVSMGIWAQDAPQPAKPKLSSVIGEVKAKDAAKLTVKSDNGDSYTVNLDEKTSFLRIQPGEKDLTKATKIAQTELNVGDRVLARGQLSEADKTMPARTVIVMTKSDLDQKQAKERGEWQRRGASGIVSDVTPTDVMITTKTRGETKTIALAVTPKTNVRRYAADSIRFNDAKPSAVTDIKKGDQLRVLGDKNDDGSKIAAEEIVFGTFRLMPATVLSVDATTGEIKVTDLDTKKPVIVLATPDTQVKKLPEMMGRMMAMQANAGAAGAGAGAGAPGGRPAGGANAGAVAGAGTPGGRQAGSGNAGAGAGMPGGRQAGGAGAAGAQAGDGAGAGGGQRPGGGMGFPGGGGGGARGDMAQMLERLPAFNLAELKVGDALIISSTAGIGASRVSAIMVLAGVEPILTAAPRSAGQINLGSWSLDMNMPQ